MEHPIDVGAFSKQVAKVCGPGTPAKLKQMAAAGLAPLGPIDLVNALYILAYDIDEALGNQARQALQKMPQNMLFNALEKQDNGSVLDGLARILLTNHEAEQKILLNRASLPETVIWIAAETGNEKVLEMIAANEARMLEHPKIIETLYFNKATLMSTADRAIELAIRNQIELTGIPSFAEVKAAIEGNAAPVMDEDPISDEEFKENLDNQEWEELDEAHLDATQTHRPSQPPSVPPSKNAERLQKVVTRMTPAQKIRLATLGNSNQRSLLIRDANKLVIMACVKSPVINESEVMRYTKYRSLPEEAVRYIGKKREWIKHYAVKLNLVQNPKTPVDLAMRFLQHLRTPDVRALERDKNIPQAIATAAKRLRNKRTR